MSSSLGQTFILNTVHAFQQVSRHVLAVTENIVSQLCKEGCLVQYYSDRGISAPGPGLLGNRDVLSGNQYAPASGFPAYERFPRFPSP